MKCPSCGAENPDYVIFCGQCATKVRDVDPNRIFSDDSAKHGGELEKQRNENTVTSLSLIAIAINVRRIFIVFALMVILSIGTSLVSLWISIRDYDIDSARSTLTIWLALAVIIMIAGLMYAIGQKRLSRASSLLRVLR